MLPVRTHARFFLLSFPGSCRRGVTRADDLSDTPFSFFIFVALRVFVSLDNVTDCYYIGFFLSSEAQAADFLVLLEVSFE
jgi:hypothetical protein